MRDRPSPNLSPREQQILGFAADGLTDTAIANKLGISEATVGTYWGRVRMKLGPYSRTELVAMMVRAEKDGELEALRAENAKLAADLNGKSVIDFSTRLLDHAPDAMLLVRADGFIAFGNQAASELFGYESLDGMSLLDLIPERFRRMHAGYRETFFEQPERREMGVHQETPALHKEGHEFPIRAALSFVETDDGTLVMCSIRPN